MPRSAAQIDAARSNGARSRGPRTPEGKARSSANARRHGLCARNVILDDPAEQAGFDGLLVGLRAAYRPIDAQEQELVRAIAHAAWQLRRAQALEERWWDGSEEALSLETILRYQARAELARARAMRELGIYRSGTLHRAAEQPAAKATPAGRRPRRGIPALPANPRA
ncbi:MAG TPA: hypothetical protein VHL31_03500 [Geminicoccus sp.]|jgi:hypothetical protein|uniref:hypothetical protein n=1 Tax=Geminicoccus sp. TaxID=2024832 RepID=UPI002E302D64|nr:hypothetical protein [Geminicoccus sp.]HEX2525353.1 hypothetical protein [Geminicoccus sp.]